MDRRITNLIRYMMDEWIPPAIRDSRWFMRPAFMFAYRRFDVAEVMEFKTHFFQWTPVQRAEFYRNLRSISRSRLTDLNASCLARIDALVPDEGLDVADFGCGSGFLLERLAAIRPSNSYVGVDFRVPPASATVRYREDDLESLQLEPRSHDIVLCCHVLEHLADYRRVMRMLVRAARKSFVFVVPKQRAYRYTLDEHVNFFQFPEQIRFELGEADATIECLDGDWIIHGSARR